LEALASNLPVITTDVGIASWFRNRQGVVIVPLPVGILTYHGKIWELHSNEEFERRLAAQMRATYRDRVKPNLPESAVEMMDKRHAYRPCVSLVKHLLETGEILAQSALISWSTMV